MSGFLGIGGHSSAKTDRGNQLAGVSGEWSVFNNALPLAGKQESASTSTVSSGLDTLDSAKKYWSNLTQGNRTALQSASAPVSNAILGQADAAKAEQANMGTSRGGGTNAANQQLETQERQAIDTNMNSQIPSAAKNLESVGTATAGIGTQQMSQALQSLGLSEETAAEIINSSMKSRETSIQANPLHAVPSILLNGAMKSLGL